MKPGQHASNDDGLSARDLALCEGIGRAALLVVSPEILGDLLQLPDGCHIDSAVVPHDQPGVLHLRVRGAGWPTKAGRLLPRVIGTVTRHSVNNGAVLQNVIDWGFPQEQASADAPIETPVSHSSSAMCTPEDATRPPTAGAALDGLNVAPLSERVAYEAWYAAATFETMGHEWTWAAWQAGSAWAAAERRRRVDGDGDGML